MGLEGVAVGVAEGLGQLLAGLGNVLAKSNAGELEAPVGGFVLANGMRYVCTEVSTC